MNDNRYAPEYIAARTVLLDVLEALHGDLPALVLVGAQAVYLRTGESNLPTAAFTTDADVAIQPDALKPSGHSLAKALERAGFRQGAADSPGRWIRDMILGGVPMAVPVDLLVPRLLSPPEGRRSARIQGQQEHFARKSHSGLEAAIIDHDRMEISAFLDGDQRAFRMRVAGPMALLLAKAMKIMDRDGSAREKPKDALDAFRLLQVTRPEDLGARLTRVLDDPALGSAVYQHCTVFQQCFDDRGPGMQLLRQQLSDLAFDWRTTQLLVGRGLHAVAEVLASRSQS